MKAINRLNSEGHCYNIMGEKVEVLLHRVPFFLEPEYNFKDDGFWEVTCRARIIFLVVLR